MPCVSMNAGKWTRPKCTKVAAANRGLTWRFATRLCNGGHSGCSDMSADPVSNENVTNEATDAPVVIGANFLWQTGCATNMPEAPNTNEPIPAPQNNANGGGGGLEKATNEAIDIDRALMVVEGELSGLDSSADRAAGPASEFATGRKTPVLPFEIDYEWMRARFAAIERYRAERLRKLNEESREREQGPRATRRARPRFDPTPAIERKRQRRRLRPRAPSQASG